MDDCYKRSGQIPAFGDWDYTNELPITQYFECARQAGLIRFSSSSGECDAYVRPADLYAVDHLKKHTRSLAPPRKAAGRGREKRGGRALEQKKQQSKVTKVCDVTQSPPTKHYSYQYYQYQQQRPNATRYQYDTVPRRPTRAPKPVDEDLYKIPPELLHSTKRKKMLGLFACLVPACAS